MATRGRKALPVSMAILLKVIEELEEKQSFSSRSALFAAVAETPYAKSVGLSAQTAMLRIKNAGADAQLKTPLGKRGRSPGEGMPANAVSKGRKRKRMPLTIVAGLSHAMGPSFTSLVNKAAKGSLRAAATLKCIDCSGGSKGEVAKCEIRECPLWFFRPYKRRSQVVTDKVDEMEERHDKAVS